jgi:hypothetical protein
MLQLTCFSINKTESCYSFIPKVSATTDNSVTFMRNSFLPTGNFLFRWISVCIQQNTVTFYRNVFFSKSNVIAFYAVILEWGQTHSLITPCIFFSSSSDDDDCSLLQQRMTFAAAAAQRRRLRVRDEIINATATMIGLQRRYILVCCC